MNRIMNAVLLCILALLCAPVLLNAQGARTTDGARNAAITMMVRRDANIDTARIVPDDATMKRKFVRCTNNDGRTDCALTDNKPVWVFSSTLVARDTAVVWISQYYMVYEYCLIPDTSTVRKLKIASETVAGLRFAWSRGKWIFVRNEPMVVC